MSILDETGRTTETGAHEPAVDWDDFHHQLHLAAAHRRPVLRCHWVRDPRGRGLISLWAPDAPTAA